MGHPAGFDAEGRAFDFLERDAALPRDEVVLAEFFGLGEAVAARYLDAQLEKLVCAPRDRGLSGDDTAGVEIDDVGHAISQL